MRRADWLLALGVTLFALLWALIPLRPRKAASCCCLQVAGETVARLPLDRADEFTWSQDGAFVTVRVEAGRARIAASSCPDQTCVHLGAISREGETVVCLPNRAVLTLETEEKMETDAILS